MTTKCQTNHATRKTSTAIIRVSNSGRIGTGTPRVIRVSKCVACGHSIGA